MIGVRVTECMKVYLQATGKCTAGRQLLLLILCPTSNSSLPFTCLYLLPALNCLIWQYCLKAREFRTCEGAFTSLVVWVAITSVNDVTDKETTAKPSKYPFSAVEELDESRTSDHIDRHYSDCTLPSPRRLAQVICSHACAYCMPVLTACLGLFDLVTLFKVRE